MKCAECGGESFEVRQQRMVPTVKGEEVEVIVPAFECTQCHEALMDGKRMNVLRRAAADAYRTNHGLLTSSEIVGFRGQLGMSQAAFAKYLNVGEASVKRWETYYIQDPGQDEHMRLKCDEAYADLNALEVHWKSHLPDSYSGHRPFNWILFREALIYLLSFARSPLFLNKALFYADFKHFQKYGRSITGARYIPLEYGPCPDQYQGMIQRLLDQNELKRGPDHELRGVRDADLSVFDDAERETLALIADLVQSDGGKHLLSLSHKEKAFIETPVLQFIDYDFARDLLV